MKCFPLLALLLAALVGGAVGLNAEDATANRRRAKSCNGCNIEGGVCSNVVQEAKRMFNPCADPNFKAKRQCHRFLCHPISCPCFIAKAAVRSTPTGGLGDNNATETEHVHEAPAGDSDTKLLVAQLQFQLEQMKMEDSRKEDIIARMRSEMEAVTSVLNYVLCIGTFRPFDSSVGRHCAQRGILGPHLSTLNE